MRKELDKGCVASFNQERGNERDLEMTSINNEQPIVIILGQAQRCVQKGLLVTYAVDQLALN